MSTRCECRLPCTYIFNAEKQTIVTRVTDRQLIREHGMGWSGSQGPFFASVSLTPRGTATQEQRPPELSPAVASAPIPETKVQGHERGDRHDKRQLSRDHPVHI